MHHLTLSNIPYEKLLVLTNQEIRHRVVLPRDDSYSEDGKQDVIKEKLASSADASDIVGKLRNYLGKLTTAKTTKAEKALHCMDTMEKLNSSVLQRATSQK